MLVDISAMLLLMYIRSELYVYEYLYFFFQRFVCRSLVFMSKLMASTNTVLPVLREYYYTSSFNNQKIMIKN